eukprot:TRINITY_DN1188_c0_g1_i9.p2 TRINITY_DN1188_c0_g1~~TRINITY_DN1188_c0_g1_i9.p2  ORF type:complete len:130 (+),score=4.14 TRINITY_DN1188_c0_g1_i9:230-619(+)
MMEVYFSLIVGLLWGLTNPFLEQGSKGTTNESEETKRRCIAVRWGLFFWRLLINWRFLVPFLLNQVGSILFYYALGNYSIALVVPVSNCISFTITYICETIMKRTGIKFLDMAGIGIVILGIFIAFFEF